MTTRTLKRSLPAVACLFIALTTAVPAQSGDGPSKNRPMPTYWQHTRYNLRWAGSAANLSYIVRYIAEGMIGRLGYDTGYIAYGTRHKSTSVNLRALGNDEVDFAITTPPVNATIAYEGKAYFRKAYPNMRAIAVFPQNDWVTCYADAKTGIKSFQDIRDRKLGVRIATNHIGDDNGISLLVEQLFRANGITPDDIRNWGGSFVDVHGAGGAARKVLDGEADLACHEYWKAFYALTDKKAVNILPLTDAAFAKLHSQFGYQRNVVPKDVFGPGIPAHDVPAVDYSDWVVLANARLPDDIAYMAARVAVEDRHSFEAIYEGRPERQRAADIPLQPELMWKNVGVPLHPGAARYYREAGLMP